MTSVLWLRRDLRIHDHPALCAAAADGPVVPLVVLDERLLGTDPATLPGGPEPRAGRRATQTGGPAARAGGGAQADASARLTPRADAYLRALEGLREDLDVVVRVGEPVEVVAQVCAEAGAGSVHVTGETTPYGRLRDRRVRSALAARGIDWVATGTPYAVSPGRVRTRAGDPFQVFTPFSRAWRDHPVPLPPPPPAGLRVRGLESHGIPAPTSSEAPVSPVTTAQARARWDSFLEDFLTGQGLQDYAGARNRPDLDGSSRLSTALKLGTLHPRTLLHDLRSAPPGRRSGAASRHAGADRFITELAWREFYADVLWHHPASAWRDLKDGLRSMRYDDPRTDPVAAQRFEAWRAGRTGYPFVDAGMRQLRTEGWMHNRARMVTASFLTKDLHLWWPHGARHFLDLLTDGDIASNSHGWQWVAGTGTDAAPYFRIFNPVTQGRRFDPDGDYVRRYVPELAHLPGAAVHTPWEAAPADYPDPIVDHAAERAEALARYEASR